MKKHYVSNGLMDVIKGLLVIICMISLMDSMNKDVEAEVNVKDVKQSEYYKELKRKQRLRYERVVKKYSDRNTNGTWR